VYETATVLTVTPAAEATLRIFMLFKGLSAEDAVVWEYVKPMLGEGTSIWNDLVGSCPNLIGDYHRFRVMELGGMEVS
jgi:hypothetical protein